MSVLPSMCETSEQHMCTVGMVCPGWVSGRESAVAPRQLPVSASAWLARGTLRLQKWCRNLPSLQWEKQKWNHTHKTQKTNETTNPNNNNNIKPTHNQTNKAALENQGLMFLCAVQCAGMALEFSVPKGFLKKEHQVPGRRLRWEYWFA